MDLIEKRVSLLKSDMILETKNTLLHVSFIVKKKIFDFHILINKIFEFFQRYNYISRI